MVKKYDSIAEGIRKLALSGEYGPSGHIPTRAALCEQFSCSMATVNRAMALLKDEGLVHANPAGTFLWPNPEGGSWDLRCSECSSVFTASPTPFQQLLILLVAAGWSARRGVGEWLYRCAEHPF